MRPHTARTDATAEAAPDVAAYAADAAAETAHGRAHILGEFLEGARGTVTALQLEGTMPWMQPSCHMSALPRRGS